MPLLDVNESKKVFNIRTEKPEAAPQDMGIRCALSREQVGLRTTRTSDEIFILRPSGMDEVTVIPNDFEVQIVWIFGEDPEAE